MANNFMNNLNKFVLDGIVVTFNKLMSAIYPKKDNDEIIIPNPNTIVDNQNNSLQHTVYCWYDNSSSKYIYTNFDVSPNTNDINEFNKNFYLTMENDGIMTVRNTSELYLSMLDYSRIDDDNFTVSYERFVGFSTSCNFIRHREYDIILWEPNIISFIPETTNN
jgi:zona occludens toxin (predicted ATPase)